MKKIFQTLALVLMMLVVMTGCRSKQEVANSYSYMKFDTYLINTSPSGIVTVHAWGSGPDMARAIEEAKKNAVAEVLFKGFRTSNDYMAQPIVTELNARHKYAEYFDRFFADGGEYRNYVKEASNKDASRTQAVSNGRQNHGVTLDIDRNGLVNQMKSDGILKR